MAGLLDFLGSPDAQMGLGLLAAAGPRADGAGFGQRMAEGVGYAKQQQDRDMQRQLAQLKMQEYQKQLAQEKQLKELAQRFQMPAQQGLSPLAGDPSAGILPSPGREAKPAGFDYQGYAGALAGIDPLKALALQQSLQKENTINKLDVKDFTPQSVGKYAQTRNYGDLVRLDKAHFANTGGQTVALDSFTGQPLNQIDNTRSPDNLATVTEQARSRNQTNALGWANNGISRERLNFDKAGGAGVAKPLPPTALKMQQASLEAINIASNTQADLGVLEKQISDGALDFGMAANAWNSSMNALGTSTEKSRNFASFKSSLEKMRNDSLRLNTGVQTDGDAQRAWNELFASINDKGVVKQRLAEIKKLNARAVVQHKLNVDGIRANYSQPALDTSGYEQQGAALGAGNPVENPKAAQTFDTKPPAHQYKGKFATAPDGKRYKSDGMIWKEVK